ncbi:MAG: FG-GAP repeat protein [Ignavibacteria bacterium]|nr:FG-GAP repeat protein [Ignavibacteria bacterium]
MTGSAVGDVLGNSVSSAGDVNNDGYSDVIVGANGSDAGDQMPEEHISIFHQHHLSSLY